MTDRIDVMANQIKDLLYAASEVVERVPGTTTGDTPYHPRTLIGVPEPDLYLLKATVDRLKGETDG